MTFARMAGMKMNNNAVLMKLKILFLKAAVCIAALAVLAFCIFALPWVYRDLSNHYPAVLLVPVLAGLYGTAAVYLVGLSKAYRFLDWIIKDQTFTEPSLHALKIMKYSPFWKTSSGMRAVPEPLWHRND